MVLPPNRSRRRIRAPGSLLIKQEPDVPRLCTQIDCQVLSLEDLIGASDHPLAVPIVVSTRVRHELRRVWHVSRRAADLV